ncbi:hypothetical protein [Streptomyces sp. NPDC097640]|uniref:hypothetical protein n=1 Tax=Streptomyces sp. NPDC097640 TaxID=3157229 RepID=UPI0033245604
MGVVRDEQGAGRGDQLEQSRGRLPARSIIGVLVSLAMAPETLGRSLESSSAV